MKLPDYITSDEVRRVCKELGVRDWTTLKEAKVLPEEASIILAAVNSTHMPVSPADFKTGLEVELEHGVVFPDFNVTNNHPVITGKIVMAHFMESLDYYQRLEVAETEGDMVKAAAAGNADKLLAKYRKLAEAKLELAKVEERLLGSRD